MAFIKFDFENEKLKIINFVKESLKNNPIVEDLGDYIPFLAYYGEEEFCKKQIEISKTRMKYGMFCGDIYPKLRKFRRYMIVPEFNTDALLGLIEFYRLTENEIALETAETIIKSLNKHFVKNGYIYSLFLTGLKINVPFVRGMNGLYVELLTDLYDITKDEKYIEIAENLAKAWINLDFFKKNKLFPNSYFVKAKYLNKLWRDAKKVTIFKHNTSIVNGLLSLYKKIKEEKLLKAIDQWIFTIKKRFFVNTIYGKLNIKNKTISEPLLKYSFSMIDILSYAYHLTKNSNYLDFAEDIASFWIKKKSKIYLFPQSPDKRETLLDSITDFSISLFRLNELTGKKFYREIGIKTVKANMKYHSYQPTKHSEFIGGEPCFLPAFVDSVDYKTGKPSTKRIKPKFIALMLKPIIYLESDEKIYNNENIFKLMRDR